MNVDAPDRGSANTRETEDDDNLAVTPTAIEIDEPPPPPTKLGATCTDDIQFLLSSLFATIRIRHG